MMCTATALRRGTGAALVASLGSTTGVAAIMPLSISGVGALMAASPAGFAVVQWPGSGVSCVLRSEAIGNLRSGRRGRRSRRRPFSQFIDPRAPEMRQFVILVTTFLVFELGWLSAYPILASRARGFFRQPRHARWLRRVSGIVYLLAAVVVATTTRATVSS